jgi:hypothetical protein
MSRGRHSRPRARGGGLPALLAVALAGGAVAVAAAEPSVRTLRLGLVGLALVGSFQLLLIARGQRVSSRALARTEDRLRTLEQRNRDEGDELHRRVLAGVEREGELRASVEVLVAEIGRLRASLESLVPVTTITAPLQIVATPSAVPAAPAAAVAQEVPTAVDIPLIQRVLAAQEASTPPVQDAVPQYDAPAQPAREVAPAAAAAVAAQPPAGDLWRAPARPEYVPSHSRVEAPVETTPVTSWVVRELQLEQPGAAVSMRILDLTTPAADGSAPAGPAVPAVVAEADREPTSTWSAFARPA